MTNKVHHAFTMIELLIVIGIIGVLVGILLPAVQAARETSRQVSCSNHMKQLVLAMHNYESTYAMLPPAMNWSGKGEPYGGGMLPIGSFDRVALGYSPSLEPDRLHANWVMKGSWGLSTATHQFNPEAKKTYLGNARIFRKMIVHALFAGFCLLFDGCRSVQVVQESFAPTRTQHAGVNST